MTDSRPPTVVVQPQGAIAVASDTIGALRGTPILLVMVLLNCAFIGAAAFYFRTQQDNVYKLVDKMIDRCLGAVQSYQSPPRRPYVPTPSHGYPDQQQHEGGDYPPSPLGSLP